MFSEKLHVFYMIHLVKSDSTIHPYPICTAIVSTRTQRGNLSRVTRNLINGLICFWHDIPHFECDLIISLSQCRYHDYTYTKYLLQAIYFFNKFKEWLNKQIVLLCSRIEKY